MMILQIIFWLAIVSVVYSVVGYPVFSLILAKLVDRKVAKKPYTPTFSLIIAAYNEEKAIAGKLENSLQLDYPQDKLEIIVASDSSTDQTDEIVKSFEDRGVRLVRSSGDKGKSATLNEAVNAATGEILAFSDATGHWSKESIRSMAQNYADPRVGCVSGWVSYTYDNSLNAQGFGVYQKFVMALRRAESALAVHCNAPGSIHSIRKDVYMPLPASTFGDMVDPYHSALKGCLTTFEEQAVSYEESRVKTGDEWAARIRICLRAWAFMFYALKRFPIIKSPLYCFQVISHKFLRWLAGPMMVIILVANVLLFNHSWVYQITMLGQFCWYSLTLLGVVLASRLKIRVKGLSGLVFYNSVNLAYLITLIKFIFGARMPRWRPSR